MANFTNNQLSEISSVIDSNVNIWRRPVVNLEFKNRRYVILNHGDGRSTTYRWDGEELRLFA